MFHAYILLIILAASITLLIWGRWRYDIVAATALMLALFTGAVPYSQAFSGFANPAVITVACVMVISFAISQTGYIHQFSQRLLKKNMSTPMQIAILTAVAMTLSAFINNVGALALIMPLAIQNCIKRNLAPSLVLMPIAVGAGLGGLITEFGTPPNILISGFRQELSGHPFGIFDFTPVGLIVAAVGLLFIILIGWRLLPKNKRNAEASGLFQIEDYITEIKVPAQSPAVDCSIQQLRKMTDQRIEVIGMIRKKRKKWSIKSSELIQANDILLISGSHDDIQQLFGVAKLDLVSNSQVSSELLQSKSMDLAEAVVIQSSRAEGRSANSLRLLSRFRVNLIALAREGKAFKSRLHNVVFKAGDVVLLQGETEDLNNAIQWLSLLPLHARNIQVGIPRLAFLPILLFVLAIIATWLHLLPLQIAFATVILLLVISNWLPLRKAYESIDWSIIVLLACFIPIGIALQTTGGTEWLSHHLLNLLGGAPSWVVIGCLLLVTMTLSDFMNNAATAIVMAPLAASLAHNLYAPVDPFLMAVAVGSSCSFLTPIGHQNNTLIIGPGGYRFMDYVRFGLPLELVILVISVPAIMWIWH